MRRILAAGAVATVLAISCSGESEPRTPAQHVRAAGFFEERSDAQIDAQGQVVCDVLDNGTPAAALINSAEREFGLTGARADELVATFRAHYC